ncbi:MAG: hypothetical protein HGA65_08480 [Oscillochloris sp.]|nr:hypothetical protein [Oscillochloris sp.]
MSTLFVRMIAAAVIAVIFLAQARKAPARSMRQIGFGLGAAAFLMFAISNGLVAAGVIGQVIQVVSIVGIVLIGVSLLLMVRSYMRGEMGDKLERAREMIAEERARTKERR